jgi:hypothetical protein
LISTGNKAVTLFFFSVRKEDELLWHKHSAIQSSVVSIRTCSKFPRRIAEIEIVETNNRVLNVFADIIRLCLDYTLGSYKFLHVSLNTVSRELGR